MPTNVNDFERYATIDAKDKTKIDLFASSIANIRFYVPIAKTVVIQSEDVANLPGLAAKYLGTRYLWYVLLHYNGMYDQIADMYPGMTLKIPQIGPTLTYLKNSALSTGIKPNSIVL